MKKLSVRQQGEANAVANLPLLFSSDPSSPFRASISRCSVCSREAMNLGSYVKIPQNSLQAESCLKLAR